MRYVFKVRKIKGTVEFKGFGGIALGNLYIIPVFTLGDLMYPNLPRVAVFESNIPAQMILSATMFNGLIYQINDKDKSLRISIPENSSTVRRLKVNDSNGKLHILCNNEV